MQLPVLFQWAKRSIHKPRYTGISHRGIQEFAKGGGPLLFFLLTYASPILSLSFTPEIAIPGGDPVRFRQSRD